MSGVLVRYAVSVRHPEQQRYVWSEVGASIFARWFVTRHPQGIALVYSNSNKVTVFYGKNVDEYPIQVLPLKATNHHTFKGSSVQ